MSLEEVNAITVTDKTRRAYAPRLRLLRKKRKEHLAWVAKLLEKEEKDQEMILLNNLPDLIAPDASEKEKKRIYWCARNGRLAGIIDSEIRVCKAGRAARRRRIFVNIEQARFYTLELTQGDRRNMASKKISIDEMKRIKENEAND